MEDKADRQSQAVGGSKVDTGVIRVLIAEDHSVMRKGMVNMINSQPDIEVVAEAGDGREALNLARQLKPDVIVMDLSMPDMDGVEVTYQIKADLPGVHVIGFSMHDEDKIIQSMRLAGAEAFVKKTDSLTELLQAVYDVTKR